MTANRDENGAETDNGAKTDRNGCCHICFHFCVKVEINTETPKMNMEAYTTGNEHRANTKRTQKQKWVLVGT